MIKGTIVYNLLLLIATPIVDEEEEDEPLFIPFPLTTKRIDQPPYSRNGPEWVEYRRVLTDPKFRTWLRIDEAAEVALKSAGRSLLFERVGMGQNLRIAYTRLDIDIPTHPPPLYERSGLLITDDSIAWATAPFKSQTAKLLNRVLWPEPLALSSWAFLTAMTKQTAAEVAAFFGFGRAEPPNTPSPGPTSSPLPTSRSPDVQKALEQIQSRQHASRPPAEVSGPSSMSSATPAAPATRSSSQGGGEVSPSGKPTSGQGNGNEPARKQPAEGGIGAYIGPTPSQAFAKRWTQLWRPLRADPPRGAVLVSGRVEMESSRAWFVIHMWMWYNPKTRSFDSASSELILRRVIMKS
ncbi:hypothetical protein N656DRAFT_701511 [Canariomyces notabilis]|uniref:Uncharacterized protein n=1 Tax=Canariomyces notabilis TaxID=2074819 RepID=A0AAN6YW91_9PEZI|nr:hypothetical protein N656DRAFT_701511 [Canariomyces arenarius]